MQLASAVAVEEEKPVSPVPSPEPSVGAEKPFRLHRRFDRTGRLIGDAGMRRL